MDCVNGISYSRPMSDAIKHITDDIFFFQENSALVHCRPTCNSPTATVLSTSFLLNHVPNSPEHWLQDFGSHTAAWVRVLSQKDWRNQGATSWILAMHWCSISVKMRFLCFPVLAGSAQAHVVWGGIVKRLLIAYFIGNMISAKKYQNVFKVIANQRWDVFWDTV